ncbi:MAG TPA: PRC-barrel domain-containing protein [Roseiarcus sp.]|jgi:sulfite reductase beta subunit-like hemoprotein
MRKALLAAAAIAALASASATAQNTTTDNPSNGAATGKMNSSANQGAMTANPTPNASATQTATQAVPDQGPNFIQVQNTDMLSSNVVGLDIHNPQNDNIGKIQDIAFDTSKKVTGYILSVGGFLGMGTHYVAVNPDAVMVSYDAQNKVWKATMNATKDQLKSAPEFKYGGQWTASRS